MNQMSNDRRAQVIAALIEGNSIRSTCRMTGAAKRTVLKLLVDIGQVAAEYQDKALRNLKLRRIQCDEIWAFCGAKQKNVPAEKKGSEDYGEVWTWTAIDEATKLVPSWLVGNRDAGCAHEFMQDLASRLATRAQLTTDGHKAYLEAVEDAFGSGIDYAVLQKIYGEDPSAEKRYSPAQCIGAKVERVCGSPNLEATSSSHVERQNLIMRMSMRRFTRLTNAFSRKRANLAAQVALHFLWYNFGRVHMTLGGTPAMAAGVARSAWKVADVVALLDPKADWRKDGPIQYRIVRNPSVPSK